MAKKAMDKAAARRIQSAQDKKGAKGDARFKSVAQSKAAKNTQKK
ncbi:hypothetical protein NEF87_001056 [Candidatus Lokiarchaeum ossiferum]|uniref:Uncharacterized protein n=1 Tax=Candidatus Lokiarchaeum ossiferum TaxID=2951803 RepID=A0ABY6HMM8_9ARCH|nr:hypothetical protein NEF87_001056 [Candidatus Lokiarchaeum sp. B-35]